MTPIEAHRQMIGATDLTFARLQAEVAAWSGRNFPGKEPVDPLLGVVEGLGELCHAFLKAKQGIRGTPEAHRAAMIDAVADTVIFLADFCHQNGIDLQQAVSSTWRTVSLRDWRKDPVSGGETSQSTTETLVP